MSADNLIGLVLALTVAAYVILLFRLFAGCRAYQRTKQHELPTCMRAEPAFGPERARQVRDPMKGPETPDILEESAHNAGYTRLVFGTTMVVSQRPGTGGVR